MQKPKQLTMILAPPPITKNKSNTASNLWVNVSDISLGTGFTTKVAVSSTLSDALEPITTEKDGDYDQRLWDALCLAHFHLSLDHSPKAAFTFAFPRKHWRTDEVCEVSLRLNVEIQKDAAYLGLLEDF
ncbi:MAG: hypothetical protein HY022_08365 [Chloroflexi bacterium]|nr:hypothetical protein [Chloroflexota bacterium]